MSGLSDNRNNSLMKLARSTWGTSANTLRSSVVALCYSAAEYSLVTLYSHKSGRCAVELYYVSYLSVVPSVVHLSHGFQCSPTFNRQLSEGRLPQTSWRRKSSNMTVGQSSLIFFAHRCYDIQESVVARFATS